MCIIKDMKRKKLEKKLTKLGWWLEKNGSNHDHWTNGNVKTTVPRHPDVNEMTAKSILKKASQNPGEKNVD